jgi:mannosyl-3-phosphoglycerate phosphatase
MARKKPPDRLIFTDLDGTLLDQETYSWKPAESALKLARRNNVPVILCTSKTRAEVLEIRKSLKNDHPFIVENGEAIYIPLTCFPDKPINSRRLKDFYVISLGTPYKQLRHHIAKMRKKGLKVKGFGDMTPKEIMELTGLSKERTKLAMKREYDEPFILENPKQELMVLDYIKTSNLQCTRGDNFFHLLGHNDKGLAVKLLTDHYNRQAGMPLVTAGIGDSLSDLPMLQAVHVPYILKQKNGTHASQAMSYIKVDGTGPSGWNRAITDFLLEQL